MLGGSGKPYEGKQVAAFLKRIMGTSLRSLRLRLLAEQETEGEGPYLGDDASLSI